MTKVLNDLTKTPVCECGETLHLCFGADPLEVKNNKNFSPIWICVKCLEKKNELAKAA